MCVWNSALYQPCSQAFYTSSFCSLAVCKKWREGEGLGNSSRDLRHNRHMSHLLSTAKWCTRPISHSVLATKMGQVPAERFTEHMKHTQAENHDSIPKGCWVISVKILSSDAIISWSEKTILFGVALLISQPSLSGKASNSNMNCR